MVWPSRLVGYWPVLKWSLWSGATCHVFSPDLLGEHHLQPLFPLSRKSKMCGVRTRRKRKKKRRRKRKRLARAKRETV